MRGGVLCLEGSAGEGGGGGDTKNIINQVSKWFMKPDLTIIIICLIV